MPGHRQAALVLVYAARPSPAPVHWLVVPHPILPSLRFSHFIIKRHSHPLRPNEFYGPGTALCPPQDFLGLSIPGMSSSYIWKIRMRGCAFSVRNSHLYLSKLARLPFCRLLFTVCSPACRNFTVNPNCRQFGQDAVPTASQTRIRHLMILSIQLFAGGRSWRK